MKKSQFPMRLYHRFLRRVLGGAVCLRFHPKSILRGTGWLKSFRLGRSVDGRGEPIPWNPYCFIRFLEPRLRNEFRVFEYGCGASTIWFSRRVNHIVAVEHDPVWRDRIATQLANGEVIYCPVDDAYIKEACNGHDDFDIVIIDGLRREECARYAAQAVSDTGCIVWDDSQEEHFQRGYPPLEKTGLARDFILGTQAEWDCGRADFDFVSRRKLSWHMNVTDRAGLIQSVPWVRRD